jgi:hypothetical protein
MGVSFVEGIQSALKAHLMSDASVLFDNRQQRIRHFLAVTFHYLFVCNLFHYWPLRCYLWGSKIHDGIPADFEIKRLIAVTNAFPALDSFQKPNGSMFTVPGYESFKINPFMCLRHRMSP